MCVCVCRPFRRRCSFFVLLISLLVMCGVGVGVDVVDPRASLPYCWLPFSLAYLLALAVVCVVDSFAHVRSR